MTAKQSTAVLLGGGGHAKVVLEAIMLVDAAAVRTILDADTERWGKRVGGVEIAGGDELLPKLRDKVTHFMVSLGGIGGDRRALLFELGLRNGLVPLTVVHPRAYVSVGASIGPGTFVAAGAIVGPGVRVGHNVVINTASVIDHDCKVGNNAHIAPTSCLGGAVTVGENAHIGSGAVILEGRNVGAHAVVAAGAVVIKDIRASTTVAGVPAHPMGISSNDS